LSERVDFAHRGIGSQLTHRAIAKIAVNYYLYLGGSIDLIPDVLHYVCDDNVRNNFVTFYYSFLEIHKLEENEISHVLLLKGNKAKQLLYCYIELFSSTNFIVILSRNYDGKDFSKSYCYDVISNNELQKEINMDLAYDFFWRLDYKEFREKHYDETQEYVMARTDRVFRILERLPSLK